MLGYSTRGSRAGEVLGKALIEWIHLMYQKQTAQRVLFGLIQALNKGEKEFE